MAYRRILSTLGINSATDVGGQLSELLGPCDFSSCSVPLLGMGRDVPDGTMFLEGDLLQNDWKIKRSREYFDRMRSVMKQLSDSWGATFVDNLIWYLGRRVITVHPLGGCSMGRNEREGVVDSWGEAFGHPGLYVADGSVMPGPTGANPALTIAALADRFADRVIERRRG
jgi:cholesterol oxidase